MNGNKPQTSEPSPNQKIIKQEVSMAFSGPLPHPEILKKYNEILQGAAERIIRMAEQQAEHRRSMEQQAIKSDIKNSKLGIWFGFIIGISGITGGIMVAIFGKQPLFGGILSFASLASLVGVFIYGTQSHRKGKRQGEQNANI